MVDDKQAKKRLLLDKIKQDKTLNIQFDDTTDPSVVWLDDACIGRYMRARNWNVDQAFEMIKDTLLWRRSYKPDQIGEEKVEELLKCGSNYVSSKDISGRPIIYMRSARDDPKFSAARKLELIVFNMELACAMMRPPVEKCVYIVDLKGFSVSKHGDTALGRQFANILQNHYPERLGMMFIINAPKIFVPCFQVFKTFVDPITKDKIYLYSKRKTITDGFAHIKKVVNEDHLEKDYGGEMDPPMFVMCHTAKKRQSANSASAIEDTDDNEDDGAAFVW